MSKANLIISIETANRELYPKVFLSYKFAETGNVAYVGTKDNIYGLVQYLDNLIYLDKGYHAQISELIYDKLIKKSAVIISLDEENGVDYDDFSTISDRFPEKIFHIFGQIFLWGSKQYQYLRENRQSFDDKNIFCYGHPRFEILKPSYRFLYDDETLNIRKKYNNFILINTSFGLGNNLLSDDAVVKNYKNRVPNVEKIMEYHKLQVKNFIELAVELSKLNRFNIILRPHPEEDMRVYKHALEGIKNIHVVHSGSVVPWLMAAEVMIHHDCTTSLESAMIGKSSIAYTKDLNSTLTPTIPHRISYRYDSLGEVINNITNEEYKVRFIDDKILEDYFSFSKNTTQLIIKTMINSQNVNHCKNPDRNLFFFKIKKNIKYFLKEVFGQKNKLFSQKIKGMDYEKVKDLIAKLNKEFDTCIKVARVNKYLFKIYQD